jgi:hypothetical protein
MCVYTHGGGPLVVVVAHHYMYLRPTSECAGLDHDPAGSLMYRRNVYLCTKFSNHGTGCSSCNTIIVLAANILIGKLDVLTRN